MKHMPMLGMFQRILSILLFLLEKLDIELRQHLMEAAALTDDVAMTEGTERSYPDLEVFGERFGGGARAVDIKCARRGRTRVSLNNRIALYTGNTYFLWPQLKFSGIARPFGEYHEHVSIVVIYTFDASIPERITDVQVVAHETWKIASRARASATRESATAVSGTGETNAAQRFGVSPRLVRLSLDGALRRRGWGVLTVWECQLTALDRLQNKIRRFLDA